MDKPLFEFTHARVESQKTRMKECAEKGICPFCWENLSKWHDAPIIKKGKFWAITANDHPYAGSKFHYLAIYKEHVSSIANISPWTGAELFLLFSKLCKDNGINGATILMRFGEMLYTGATISHLHAHLVSGVSGEEVPNPEYPDSFITSVLGYKVPK